MKYVSGGEARFCSRPESGSRLKGCTDWRGLQNSSADSFPAAPCSSPVFYSLTSVLDKLENRYCFERLSERSAVPER